MTRLDHLLIAVTDVEAAATRWTAAGLPAADGGRHPTGTHNALVRGPEPAYLELIGADQAATSPNAVRVLEGAGPLSWAVAVDDITATRSAVVAVGHEPGEVQEGARTTPDGEQLSWRTCELGLSALHPYMPFLIDWRTPMAPGPANGPRLRNVSLAVPNPAALAELLGACGLRRIDAPDVRLTDGQVEIELRAGTGRLVGASVVVPAAPAGHCVLDGFELDVLTQQA